MSFGISHLRKPPLEDASLHPESLGDPEDPEALAFLGEAPGREGGAHVEMLAVLQPFVSGAISKTMNLPAKAPPPDICECLVLAWKLGVKCISVYRDGSKLSQLVTAGPARAPQAEAPANVLVCMPFHDFPFKERRVCSWRIQENHLESFC